MWGQGLLLFKRERIIADRNSWDTLRDLVDAKVLLEESLVLLPTETGAVVKMLLGAAL